MTSAKANLLILAWLRHSFDDRNVTKLTLREVIDLSVLTDRSEFNTFMTIHNDSFNQSFSFSNAIDINNISSVPRFFKHYISIVKMTY